MYYCDFPKEFSNMQRNDIPNTVSASPKPAQKAVYIPPIRNVIFNPPATIILWEDGTKTVVKCAAEEIFDSEKGFAIAIAKKALGNTGSYARIFRKWCIGALTVPVEKLVAKEEKQHGE